MTPRIVLYNYIKFNLLFDQLVDSMSVLWTWNSWMVVSYQMGGSKFLQGRGEHNTQSANGVSILIINDVRGILKEVSFTNFDFFLHQTQL